MKAYLSERVRSITSPLQARNWVREYLQARILGTLQRIGAMIPLAFHGGTALRFLYAIPRHSEDLDFALERAPEQYDIRATLRAIRDTFTRESYDVSLKVNDKNVVHSAFVRFPGLLFELGLSPHRTEALSVKLEVDTNPPAGAGLSTTLIRRHVTLQVQHHDQASLLAGKLHALLQRPYTKGRDLYDLLWYFSNPDWPRPNLTLLNNALQQSGWIGNPLTPKTWPTIIRTHIEKIAWDQIVADVQPFLEREVEIDMLTRENLLRVLDAQREHQG